MPQTRRARRPGSPRRRRPGGVAGPRSDPRGSLDDPAASATAASAAAAAVGEQAGVDDDGGIDPLAAAVSIWTPGRSSAAEASASRPRGGPGRSRPAGNFDPTGTSPPQPTPTPRRAATRGGAALRARPTPTSPPSRARGCPIRPPTGSQTRARTARRPAKGRRGRLPGGAQRPLEGPAREPRRRRRGAGRATEQPARRARAAPTTRAARPSWRPSAAPTGRSRPTGSRAVARGAPATLEQIEEGRTGRRSQDWRANRYAAIAEADPPEAVPPTRRTYVQRYFDALAQPTPEVADDDGSDR